MSTELTKVVEFTDEELSERDDPVALIVERLQEASNEWDGLISEEMMNRGIDLKITMELLPR